MDKMKYKDLIRLEWCVQAALSSKERQWDEQTEKYGKDTILYDINHREVTDLRAAVKTLKQTINILRKNDLYTHGD